MMTAEEFDAKAKAIFDDLMVKSKALQVDFDQAIDDLVADADNLSDELKVAIMGTYVSRMEGEEQ